MSVFFFLSKPNLAAIFITYIYRELEKSRDRLGEGKGGIVYIEDIICRRLGAELRAGCCKLEVEMGR